jgi:PAS domain S-box-containing protein
VGVGQQELQRRWQYLAEAQRLRHSGIFVWHVGSNTLEWSDKTYRILGFTRDTSPSVDLVFDRVHPEDRERFLDLRDRAARDGMELDFEHRLLMPDGDIRYLHVVAHVGSHGPGIREYIGIVSDITDRKRAEDERQALASALQQSNARLEEAQRLAHIGHYEWNLIENRVTYSDELCRIYAIPPQKGPFDAALIFERIHPDDRERVTTEAEETVRNGTHAKAEHRIVLPDGEVRYILGLGTVKRDASGRAYEMFGTGQDITERKLAEHSLRRSQFYLSEGERLAHMGSWASSDLGISWSDELGIYWSDEVYKIFGFDRTKGAPNLQQFFAAIHPQDRDRLAEAMKQLHERHCGCDITSRIIRPDGQIRYVRCVGIPVVEDGIFKGYHGTTIDVTEHELLTLELRREQAYLAEAQRLAHAGSWASNLVTRQVFHSSEENNRLYGFDVSQSTNPFDLHYSTILAEDEPALRAKLENAIRAGEDFDLEYRIRRADGAIRFLRGIGHHNPGQDLGEYFGITIDITDRKLVEQEREALSNALQQSNAYLAEAQSLTHVGSWACNLVTQQIFHSSEENARMYGFDPSQGPIPFESFYGTILPEDEQAVRAKLEGAISAGGDYDVEFRIRRTDGAIRRLRGIGHHSSAQEAGEYVGITMDITDQKRAEEERERLRQLEAEVAHTNRVNMMGELAAALAHEIKQPIAASITSANALLRWLAHEPPDLDRARAAAARIEQDANRAADVISSLQSFYRTGIPTKRQSVDLKEIIGEMTILLRAEAERYAIATHQEIDVCLPRLFASRVQLQQILMNLMLNAIEAMKDTGGEMTIKAKIDSKGLVVTSVSDTGVGLAAENIERIFDPFHTTKPQGTGMGLTITRSIVESYGGRVWANPNQGPGTTFVFTLPGETETQT